MPWLIITGQHPALDPADFGLADFRAVRLGCNGQADPHAHVRAVTAALLPQLHSPPDLLVVQGDTSSALGATLAGFTAGVPVAQVEAGLRTHDPALPWPEEEYPTAIDAHAELLFAPTQISEANLLAEAVPGAIHITGNTGIDATLLRIAELAPRSLRACVAPRILVTCHRRESWSEGLQSIAAALVELAKFALIEMILHPNAFVADKMMLLLGDVPNVTLTPPCDHSVLLGKMRDADLVLSDSGGIQEEAPLLGVPLLVLTEKTERPEGICAGSARLVGTSAAAIVDETTRLLADPSALQEMGMQRFPYGDGKAAARIAAIIEAWLSERPS